MGNYTLAEQNYLEAKDIRERVLGKENQDYATSLDNLGYATSLHNLGLVYVSMGNYALAEQYHLEVKDIIERILGKEHQDYATALDSLGSVYVYMGNYALAEQYHLEAKGIRERVLGKEHPHYVISLDNLGLVYGSMGNYALAEQYLLEAKDIFERVFGKEHPHYAASLFNLGLFHESMGNYALAEQYLLEAKNILEKVLGKEHLEYAISLHNLGFVNKSIGNYTLAEQYLLEAKDIFERVLGKEHPNYAASLNNLGSANKSMENYTLAEQYLLEAKGIREKTLGKEHPHYAVSLSNLGEMYKSMGNYALAEQIYLEEKDILERILGKEHPRYANSLNNLGVMYTYMGDYIQALALKRKSNHLFKTLAIRNFMFLSEQQRSHYWDKMAYRFEASYSLSWLNPTLESNCLNYDNTLFTKGILLRTTNAVRASIYNSGDHELIAQFETLCRLRQQIAALRQSGSENEAFIQNLEQEADTLDKSLIQKSSAFMELQADFTLGWQDVRDHLQPNEVAIEFVSFWLFDKEKTNRYAALILRSGMNAPEWVPLCEEGVLADIFARLTDRVALVEPEEKPKEQTKILYDEYGPQLYAAIWQPMEEAKTLEGVKTIYYAPSGLLHKLSFDAIPAADGKRLSDLYDMNLVSSTREVVYRHNKNTEKPESAAVYGGLLYDLPAGRMTEEAKPYQSQEAQTNTDLPKDIPRSVREERLEELHFTMLESTRIHDQLINSKIRTDLYVAARGNKESFKKLDKKKTGIIHLATHGFFIEDIKKDYEKKRQLEWLGNRKKVYDNPLLRSGLALAGANNAWSGNPIEGVENGILFADDIAKMNLLGAELVVLSACNTGLGEIKNGEGVFGLQRAFKLAGAETVIMSLWSVADKFTYKFMKTFYENWLKGKSKQEAFKETQRHFRADEKYTSPYYWAAFVCLDG